MAADDAGRAQERDFIFGYGSLIDATSRQETTSSGAAYPARVRGLARRWNYRVASATDPWTALGAVRAAGAATNGVLIQVSPDELAQFDKREENYRREEWVAADLQPYFPGGRWPDLGKGAHLWVYIPERPEEPTAECPITQSYVDVCLSGCLKIDEAFALEFLRTTGPWEHWVNDRVSPRTVRRAAQAAPVLEIDRVLGAWLLAGRRQT